MLLRLLFSFAIMTSLAAASCNNTTVCDSTCDLLESGLGSCVRRCCPSRRVRTKLGCMHMQHVRDLLEDEGLKVYSGRQLLRTMWPEAGMLVGLRCEEGESSIRVDEEIYLQQDGRLYVVTSEGTSEFYAPDKYCLETFLSPSGDAVVDALFCIASEESHPDSWRSICMLISSVFILATLGVYVWLPELRNLHGQVLMCYLGCLFAGFVVLGGMKFKQSENNISKDLCYPMGVFSYMALIAAFFWLNVMCFDIYWTFSGRRGITLRGTMFRSRFFAYCAYAFGLPILLTAVMMGLEYSGIKSKHMPNFREQGCFLYGNSKYIYFCGPIVVLCVMNIIFFVMTARKIASVNKQTAVLNSGESATHDRRRNENDKQRFLLYIKLFVVMGVNWILEIISTFFDQDNIVFIISDAYNMLIGLTIFCLFVCKKTIYKLIKNRYRQLRGQPMSRQGTSTTTTAPVELQMQMATKNGH